MTKTLYISSTENTLNSESLIEDSFVTDFRKTYEVSNKGGEVLAASASINIPFGNIVSATMFKIKSDLPLTVQINGDTTNLLNVTYMFNSGAYIQINVTNQSGTTAANIEYEIYGDVTAMSSSASNIATYTTTPVTLTSNNYYVRMDLSTASRVNLPPATASGKVYVIKSINTGTVSIYPNGSDTIDETLSVITIVTSGAAIAFIDSGIGNWDKYNGITIE